MALGYNDRQRLLGLPENENADLDNLVGVPVQPERQFAQGTALENSGSVAPIKDNSDIPVQTRIPAATDVSAQTKTKTDQSNAVYNQSTGNAPDLLEEYRKLMAERKAEMQGAQSAERMQNVLAGINDNIGLIVGGGAARNSGASVQAPKLAALNKTDYSGNVDKMLNPELEGVMEQYKMLQAEKQNAHNRRIQEEQLKIAREGNDIKKLLAAKKVGGPLGLTEGQKSADRDFGKRYNEWTTGGTQKFDSNIAKLEEAMKQLADRKGEGDDRFIGRLPDWANPFEKDIQLREMVRSAAQESLRATLGAQFTEKEGEAIMKRAYDPTLSPESNAARIKSTLDELKAKKGELDRRSDYFAQTGSLVGVDNGATTPARENSGIDQNTVGTADKTVVRKQYSPSRNQTRIKYSDGTEEVVDGRQ